MKRPTAVALALVLGMASGAVAVWAYQRGPALGSASLSPEWTESQWPLAADQWGSGKFFHCGKERCGSETKLYVRAKIGFCKCDVGVDSDEELERIGDLALFSAAPAALGAGHPIKVAWMKGRSRAFTLGGSFFTKASALSVGFNDRCDAITATVVTDGSQAAALEPAVLDFLNSERVMGWAKLTLGL